MRIFTADLDSTLCDTSARFEKHGGEKGRHLINWRSYAMDCHMDAPFEGTVRLVRALQVSPAYDGWFVVSARDEAAREKTESWLTEQVLVPTDILLSDGSVNASSHAEYKAKRILELQEAGHEVEFHLEDHEEVREAVWDLCKVPVIIINPGYAGLR